MVETVIAAVLIAGGVVAVTRNPAPSPDTGVLSLPDIDTTPDLPCPWCNAATSESDVRCPRCGQRFG